MRARWIKIAALLALVVIGGAAALVASHWPFTRGSIVSALQEKFSSAVEFTKFQGTYFTPGCVVEGVTFRRNSDSNTPPIATVKKLTIQGSYLGLFTIPKRVRRVRVEGLRVFVSPLSERNGDQARPASSLGQFAVILNEIVADGAVVEVSSGEPGAEPLKFEVHKLTLNSVADDRPMSFHATLHNPTPPAEIRTDGQFGPLRTRDVGRIFLSGSYTFQRGDLGVFPGIKGTLASAGKFNGVLEHIALEGDTDAPDFRISRANHAVHLITQFRAIVNGMDGDVALESVRAQFGQTSVVWHGEVATRAGSQAKTVSLEATGQHGQVQDWLHLLSKAERPAATGGINFNAQILVPPGKRDFIERVNLQGDLGIATMRFNRSTQGKVDALSQLALGKKESDDPASVVGNLKGHVVLKNAIATFLALSFDVPGAFGQGHGTYGLLTERINIHGTLQVDNKLSKGSTGTKSFLLKFVEPFLKKKNTGEIVPIELGGTFHNPTYGLDLSP